MKINEALRRTNFQTEGGLSAKTSYARKFKELRTATPTQGEGELLVLPISHYEALNECFKFKLFAVLVRDESRCGCWLRQMMQDIAQSMHS